MLCRRIATNPGTMDVVQPPKIQKILSLTAQFTAVLFKEGDAVKNLNTYFKSKEPGHEAKLIRNLVVNGLHFCFEKLIEYLGYVKGMDVSGFLAETTSKGETPLGLVLLKMIRLPREKWIQTDGNMASNFPMCLLLLSAYPNALSARMSHDDPSTILDTMLGKGRAIISSDKIEILDRYLSSANTSPMAHPFLHLL
jgi:hypothetical protein